MSPISEVNLARSNDTLIKLLLLLPAQTIWDWEIDPFYYKNVYNVWAEAEYS